MKEEVAHLKEEVAHMGKAHGEKEVVAEKSAGKATADHKSSN